MKIPELTLFNIINRKLLIKSLKFYKILILYSKRVIRFINKENFISIHI